MNEPLLTHCNRPMLKGLEQLNIAKYRFVLRVDTQLRLPPFIGNALRGGFGHAFKRSVCIEKDYQAVDCQKCLLLERCPYPYVFEWKLPEGKKSPLHFSEVPRPFVIEPIDIGKTNYVPGEHLEFYLILLGEAIPLLPYFVVAFTQLGKIGLGKGRGKYTLEIVSAIHLLSGVETPIFSGRAQRIRSISVTCTAAKIASSSHDETTKAQAANQLVIDFQTPTRLMKHGKLLDTPSFEAIVRSLLRRVSSLTFVYGEGLWQPDFQNLITCSQSVAMKPVDAHWIERTRYSQRQQQKIPLGGFVGQFECTGALADFIPLLLIGEVLHVGKATSFGHGKYRVYSGHASNSRKN